jgi:alpha-mannosidase
MTIPVNSRSSTGRDSPHDLHMIGNAHMDPVWVWDWREGFGEVWSTFKSALDRIAEHEDVTFTASSAAYYSWIERHDPAMFESIKAAVASGRWFFVGGMWIEPDCNIPSGESLCRQLLYGQRYFQRAFGSLATIGYNVDSFGHAAGLPGILRGAGLDAYVMMRPADHEKAMPANAFLWSDPSGCAIAAYRIPGNYETDSVDALAANVESASELSRVQGTPQMCFFGVGNHGGGPTRSMIEQIDGLRSRRREIIYSDPGRYFHQLRVLDLSLPLVEGELQHHAPGCYSVSAWVKASNRSGESALLDAETLEAVASSVVGRVANGAELSGAWEELLLCQFHDVLAGTSSDSAYRTIRSRYGYVETVADGVTTNAIYEIAHRIDTRIESIDAQERESPWTVNDRAAAPFVVYNPLAWPVRQFVAVARSGARVLDSAGTEIASQAIASGELTIYPSNMLFAVDLEPLGYEVFWLQGSRLRSPDPVAATTPEIKNDRFSVAIDGETGIITSLVDLATSTELLSAEGIRPLVLADESDTWSHGLTRFDGEPSTIHFAGWEVVEDGPLRSTLRLRFDCGESHIVEDVELIDGSPYVQIRIRAEWSTPRCVVKLALPWIVGRRANTVAGASYSFQERDANGNEEVMQGWLDYYDVDVDRGVGLTTDHLYGYDARDGVVRLTILRNPLAADHGGPWAERIGEDFSLTDSGHHDATIRIHPHVGNWQQANLPARADEHHRQPIVVAETYHGGSLPGRGSFLAVEPQSAGVIRVVKRAEGGDGAIVRLAEPVGRLTSLQLSGGVLGRAVSVDLTPFEVKTIFIPDDTEETTRTVSIVELDDHKSGIIS